MTTLCQSRDHVEPIHAPDGLPNDLFIPDCTARARIRITYFDTLAAQLLGEAEGHAELLVCKEHYPYERHCLTHDGDITNYHEERLGLTPLRQAAVVLAVMVWVALGMAFPESVFAVWYRVIEVVMTIVSWIGGAASLLWHAVTNLL